MSDKTQDELESLLVIDENNLEGEWADQPIRYINIVRLCARTQAEMNNKKVEISQKYGQLSLRFKVEGIAGIDRVTDKAIEAATDSHPDIIALQTEFTDAQHRLAILDGLKKAYEMRERSLKYIQMLQSMPLTNEDRELGRAAKQAALERYLED